MDAVMIPMEKSKYSGRMVKRHVPYLVGRKLRHADAVLSMRIAHEKRRKADWRSPRNENEGYGEDPKWQEIIDCEAELNRLNQDEINALYASEQEKEEQERYFNRPDAMADYVHWSQCAHWTLDEAVALSLGREPRVVGIIGVTAHAAAGSPFAREYLRRTDLVKRAREARELFEPTLPGWFLTWAKLRELEQPKALEEALAARGRTVVDMKKIEDDLKAITDQLMQQNKQLIQERDDLIERGKRGQKAAKPLHPREKQSMLKLIYGMAVAYHGYDPEYSRSGTVKSIRDDLTAKGIQMDDETILKYLREGAEEFSRMDGAPSS